MKDYLLNTIGKIYLEDYVSYNSYCAVTRYEVKSFDIGSYSYITKAIFKDTSWANTKEYAFIVNIENRNLFIKINTRIRKYIENGNKL